MSAGEQSLGKHGEQECQKYREYKGNGNESTGERMQRTEIAGEQREFKVTESTKVTAPTLCSLCSSALCFQHPPFSCTLYSVLPQSLFFHTFRSPTLLAFLVLFVPWTLCSPALCSFALDPCFLHSVHALLLTSVSGEWE